MYRKSLFKFLILFTGGIIFSSINVSSVLAATTCVNSSFPSRIIVNFDEVGIRSDKPESENRHHVDRTVSLPAGTYNIIIIGSDDREAPISVQPEESFKLILKNGSTTVATTPATPDLTDSIVDPKVYSNLSLSNFVVSSTVNTAIAYHDAFPDTTNPNSVHPVCAGFDLVPTSGTLTSSAPSCLIASGSSSCNVNLTWSTTNPVGTSIITKPVNTTVATGNTGTNVSVSVKHSSETFYLYNNGVLLDQETIYSGCTSGTSWDGSKCAPIVCTSPSFPSRTIVGYDVSWPIMSSSTTQYFQSRPVSLPAGTYNVTVAATDAYLNRFNVNQPNESFKLILKNSGTTVATTTETPDLIDNVISNTKIHNISNFIIPSTINTIEAFHSYYYNGPTGIANSVRPVCAGFDAIAPTVSLSATTPVAYNTASTLTWSSTNATSCTASGAWSGTKATSGTQSTGNLISNKTYTLTCTGAGLNSAPSSATVTIGTPPPIVSLSSTPSSISYGSSSTLTWSSTNATSCTASGDWTGTKATSGSESTGSLTSSKTYNLTCYGPGGNDSDPTTVTVGAQLPIISISASPNPVAYNTSSTINWSSTNATSCTASGDWTGTKATSGSESTGNLISSKTYTLTCTGPGGNASNSTTVNVSAGVMSGTLTPTSTSWYNANWPYRVKLTIPSTKVSANLTNFPVYVNLNNLPTEFHSHVNQTDARDIRVTKADGVTELPREVVSYSSLNNTGELHFLANYLSSVSDNDFYIYYGNTSAVEPLADSTYGSEKVWSDYTAVLHMTAVGNAVQLDSTANGNNFTPYNMESGDRIAGKFTYALDFDGVDEYLEKLSPLFSTPPFTLSAWGNYDDYGTETIISTGDKDAWAAEYGIGAMWTTNVYSGLTARDAANSIKFPAATTLTRLTDVLIHGVFTNTSSRTIYYNGGNSATETTTINPINLDATRIGKIATKNGNFWDGRITEVRVRPSVLTSAWISTEYSNQNNSATFFNTGSEEAKPVSVDDSSCIIALGESTCAVNLSWSIVNPEGDTTAITAIDMPDVFLNASLGSGSESLPVSYPSRIFYLYNNAKSLVPTSESPSGSGVTITSSCVSGTNWNGNICALFPPTLTFTANPTTIIPGDSSLLTWSSTNATSCTASGDWTGVKATSGSESTGSLTLDKTYTLTCTGAGGQISDQVTVGVDLTKDIKKFEEN